MGPIKLSDIIDQIELRKHRKQQIAVRAQQVDGELDQILNRVKELKEKANQDGVNTLKSVGDVTIEVVHSRGQLPSGAATVFLQGTVEPADSLIVVREDAQEGEEAAGPVTRTTAQSWSEDSPAVWKETLTFKHVQNREAVVKLTLRAEESDEVLQEVEFTMERLLKADEKTQEAWYGLDGKKIIGKSSQKNTEKSFGKKEGAVQEGEKSTEDRSEGLQEEGDEHEQDEDEDAEAKPVPRVEIVEETVEEGEQDADSVTLLSTQPEPEAAILFRATLTLAETEKLVRSATALAQEKEILMRALEQTENEMQQMMMYVQQVQQAMAQQGMGGQAQEPALGEAELSKLGFFGRMKYHYRRNSKVLQPTLFALTWAAIILVEGDGFTL